jgi:Nif-specific regulatory protein
MQPVLQRNRELSAILELSRVLTSSFDLNKNLATGVQILATDLEMRRGCMFLLHPLI